MYDKTARAIQAADPKALVGGPGISKPLIAGDYREKFIDYVRLNDLPLDFFSWHFYAVDSNDPLCLCDGRPATAHHRRWRGFGSAKNVLDEWNADPADEESSTGARAAFAASSLIYMLGGPIDAQTYRGTAGTARMDGVAGDAVGSALGALGRLRTAILIRSSGGDDSGFAVVAGRSKDNRLVQILIQQLSNRPEISRRPARQLGHHASRSAARSTIPTMAATTPLSLCRRRESIR